MRAAASIQATWHRLVRFLLAAWISGLVSKSQILRTWTMAGYMKYAMHLRLAIYRTRMTPGAGTHYPDILTSSIDYALKHDEAEEIPHSSRQDETTRNHPPRHR